MLHPIPAALLPLSYYAESLNFGLSLEHRAEWQVRWQTCTLRMVPPPLSALASSWAGLSLLLLDQLSWQSTLKMHKSNGQSSWSWGAMALQTK